MTTNQTMNWGTPAPAHTSSQISTWDTAHPDNQPPPPLQRWSEEETNIFISDFQDLLERTDPHRRKVKRFREAIQQGGPVPTWLKCEEALKRKSDTKGKHENCLTDGYTCHYYNLWMGQMREQINKFANLELSAFKFDSNNMRLFEQQEQQCVLYKRRCVDTHKDLGALTSARVPDKAPEVTSDDSDDKVPLLIQKYEKFLGNPQGTVKANVGNWFDDLPVLNQKNPRILKEDHMFMKKATLAEKKKRFSELVRSEIKHILKEYHDTLLHYRGLGDERVEIVFQSPWSDLYEALRKEHQEDGTTVQEGI